jgi:hypothetical protein
MIDVHTPCIFVDNNKRGTIYLSGGILRARTGSDTFNKMRLTAAERAADRNHLTTS